MPKRDMHASTYAEPQQATIPLHKLRWVIDTLKLVEVGTHAAARRVLKQIIATLEEVRDDA